MRILYVASGIPVPGTLGGSTHVYEVARGLARRGHDIHVVAASRTSWTGIAPFARPVSLYDQRGGFHLHYQDIPKAATLLGAWPLVRLVRMLQPDAIIERYYNFAGVGVWAAHRFKIPCLLEVNALIVDPPQVFKRRLDNALGTVLPDGHGPMRRWAAQQCRWADRIVTPLHTTVPPEIPREKIVELPWGADVTVGSRQKAVGRERRQKAGDETGDGRQETGGSQKAGGRKQKAVRSQVYSVASWPRRIPHPASRIPHHSAIFLGSFRSWHGVIDFVRAGALLLASGHDYRFVLVGDGPERAQAEQLAVAWPGRFTFTGAVPYEQVPALLAEAAVGVAPFNTAVHPALQSAGFFWSPLKVYEYMAASLPVVTIDLPPLNTIVREGQEGVLYPEGNIPALAAAIARLLDNPTEARAMGVRACERVVAHYSWERHCGELERVLAEIVQR